TTLFRSSLCSKRVRGWFNNDPLSHHKLGLTMIYLLKSSGFLNRISVAKSPPNDCPIMVFEELVLYFSCIYGCSSFSMNDINLLECPEVGFALLSSVTVVGNVKSLLLSTVAIPTTIDFGTWLTHSKLLNCTSPTIWIKSSSAEP